MNYLATAGPRADPATTLTWGFIVLSTLVVAIVAVAVFSGILARKRTADTGGPAAHPVAANTGGMSWIYVGLPLTILALAIFLVWTLEVMAAIDSPSRRPALTLEVSGHEWWWGVRYLGDGPGASFSTANEIHIPVGEPVLVKLIGADVIHSFWVPALTGKTETIPGRVNVTWMQADRAGVYRGQCTEYCGAQHAHMAVFVVAQAPTEFEAWRRRQLQTAPAPTTAAATAGEAVFAAHCASCHAVRGTSAHGDRGPDLTHLMSRQTLAAGLLVNNPGNLSGWISDPQSLKPDARMPTTYLSGPQLTAVRDYLETLK